MPALEKTERKPYNPYPLGVWNVEGISSTAQVVLGCLGVHSSYLGETILGIERKDDKGTVTGGLVKKTKLSKRGVYDGLHEIYTKGRISREDRRGTKWGRNSSRTKIWLTAEELTKAGAEDLSLYPAKTLEEIAAIAEANTAAARVRSETKRKSRKQGSSAKKANVGSTHIEHTLNDAAGDSTCTKRTTSQTHGARGAKLMVQQVQSHDAPRLHGPSVFPSLVDLQESFEPSGKEPKAKTSSSPAEGKKEKAKTAGKCSLPEATALSEGTAAALRLAGCPEPVIALLGTPRWSKAARALSANDANLVMAYRTIAGRHKAFSGLWMPSLHSIKERASLLKSEQKQGINSDDPFWNM